MSDDRAVGLIFDPRLTTGERNAAIACYTRPNEGLNVQLDAIEERLAEEPAP